VWRGIEAAAAAAAAAKDEKGKGKGSAIEGRRLSVSSLEESAAKRQKLSVSPDASRTKRPGVHLPDGEEEISRPESRGSTKSEGAQPKQVLMVENVPPRSEDTVVTDLFLIVHGIGQGVSTRSL
jgi:hypothetical protein